MSERLAAGADQPRRRWGDWWEYGLIVFVGFLAMHGALGAVFYMDDHGIFTGRSGSEGSWLTRWRVIPNVLVEATLRVAGPSPFVFHLWNLAFHLIGACLVYQVGREMLCCFLGGGEVGGRERFAALFGALVFVSHPLASEAVHYARCIMIQLVTLFTLASVWGTVRLARGHPGSGLALMAVGFFGAMYSKDPGIFQAAGAMFIVGAGLLLNAKGGIRGVLSRRRLLTRSRVVGLIIGGGVFLYAATLWVPWVARLFETRSELMIPYVLTQSRIFWGYAARMVWPGGAFGLSVDHYVPWSEGWGDWVAVASLAGVVLIGLSGLYLLLVGRDWRRLCGVLVLLALFPVLLRFGYSVRELMVEYRVYPAMPWVGLLIGVGLSGVWAKRRLAGLVVVTAVVAASVAFSMTRSRVWWSEERLASDVVTRYPLNIRGMTQLQGVAFRAGDYDAVIALQERIVAAFEESELYNEAHAGVRGYDMGRVHEGLGDGEQLVVFALAKRDGLDAAYAYGKARLRDLVRRYPMVYVNEEEGRLYEGNSLVRALRAVAEKREEGLVNPSVSGITAEP